MNATKVIVVPGNGGATPGDNWFPYVERELSALGIKVLNRQFPDPLLARREFWLPFLRELGADQNTILVGHSSGAVAAMRFAEENPVLGSVLVAGYLSDLGLESERKSGYFDRPWNWDAIRANQSWIIQFSSTDDPFIPIVEARSLREALGSEYHEYEDQGHFGNGRSPKEQFPELIEAIKIKLKKGDV